jgi:hypothetical protein
MNGFTQNDPRGEYWLYSEGALQVNVGRGGISGGCHFNTSDVHLQSGGPLDCQKVAEILATLMVKFGEGHGGYKRLILHRDGKYDLAEEDVMVIDQALTKIGFSLLGDPKDQELQWTKSQC